MNEGQPLQLSPHRGFTPIHPFITSMVSARLMPFFQSFTKAVAGARREGQQSAWRAQDHD
jgi:hypothetical protein